MKSAFFDCFYVMPPLKKGSALHYGFRDREYFKLKIYQLPEISSVKEV